MDSIIEDVKVRHPFSSDQKLLWWDYGEWVEEPDLIEFTYKAIRE